MGLENFLYKAVSELLYRSHTEHSESTMGLFVVVSIGKKSKLVTVFVNIYLCRILSQTLPKSSVTPFYLSIVFWCVWRILDVSYPEFFKEIRESRSSYPRGAKFASIVCPYTLNRKRRLMNEIPDEFHTGTYTMFSMNSG